MQLAREAFGRARHFLQEEARSLERALFAFHFEGGAVGPVRASLSAFRNTDGGFGHGLEPDLALPDSSVLCTLHALEIHLALGTSPGDAEVRAAVDWLLAAFDPELGAWRQVSREAEDHPHAGHWSWALHEDGTRWPMHVLPGAEVLVHLYRDGRAPAERLRVQTQRLVEAVGEREDLGGDALLRCDLFARTPEAPAPARDAVREGLRVAGNARVSRDPAEWEGYVAKPLKLAPFPECVLAEDLAEDVARNLDYEIAHQQEDGSWAPNWSWPDRYAREWVDAERAWRGILTLERLRSLRAYGRIEGAD